MDPLLRELAARQADVVAAWQLLDAGWTRAMIDHHLKQQGWRVIHPGVYALTHAPLTRRQRWLAATLTSPDSFLSHASAGACYGFREFDGRFEIITRPGRAGRRQCGALLIFRSAAMDGETSRYNGIAITTAERTLIDLAPHLDDRAIGRMFREALRLEATTANELQAALERCRGRRRNRLLAGLAARYSSLPYHRTRSNPEARALEILHDAGVEPPMVNIKVAGEEADLTWPRHRRIVEIDGPDFHRFRDEDARKQAKWERAGYTVRRLPSDDVYHRPEELLAAATG